MSLVSPLVSSLARPLASPLIGGGAVGDPFSANVTSLLNFNNNFVDAKGNTWDTFGTLSFGTGLYGTSCLNLQSGYLLEAENSNFAFGSGDFCIEAYINPRSVTSGIIVTQPDPSQGGFSPFRISLNGGQLTFLGSADGVNWTRSFSSGGTTVQVSAWTHIAVTRQGNTWRGFINGVSVWASTTAPTMLMSSSGPITIGAEIPDGVNPGTFFDGLIEDFRVTKGVARYTTNFTPPTSELRL